MKARTVAAASTFLLLAATALAEPPAPGEIRSDAGVSYEVRESVRSAAGGPPHLGVSGAMTIHGVRARDSSVDIAGAWRLHGAIGELAGVAVGEAEAAFATLSLDCPRDDRGRQPPCTLGDPFGYAVSYRVRATPQSLTWTPIGEHGIRYTTPAGRIQLGVSPLGLVTDRAAGVGGLALTHARALLEQRLGTSITVDAALEAALLLGLGDDNDGTTGRFTLEQDGAGLWTRANAGVTARLGEHPYVRAEAAVERMEYVVREGGTGPRETRERLDLTGTVAVGAAF